MAIYRGAGGASDSVDDATVNAVAAYAAAAANSATSADASEAAAAASAASAAGSVSSVATYASNAATSASNAASSASLASVSSSEASSFAGNASASASAAASSASDASNSATNADTSEANAATSASSAATSASNAATSAASALAIYGNTTAMNNAVSAAANSASNAATSASSATTSAATATTQAANALSSANAADISEASALTYSNNAATSANNALNSANASAASAASAATSAASASTSATNSASIYGGLSAVNAAVATTTANANNAATSATNAANSATQAAASAASASAIVLGVASGMPSIKPTLNLDFANSQTVDPRITFTRTGTAAYYDGKTTVKAEENLLTYSQEFDNAAWTKGNVTVTANTTTAPDGTSTADTLDEGTATNYHNLTSAVPTSIPSGTNTLSVYVKNISGQYLILTLTNAIGAYCSAIYDTVAGTVATSSALGSGYSVSSTSITSVGSGWYRCVMTCVTPSTAQFNIGMSDSATIGSYGLRSYTGTSRQIYIWGAQLEQRSTVTAYTPTTTQAITNYIPAIQYAPANTPRIDFDPITGECKGLLIEEQRTNLLTYSEQFDNAAWTKTRTGITANAVVAPDGAISAEKLVEDTTASASHLIERSVTLSDSLLYSSSVYVKAGERTWVRLQSKRKNGTFANTWFNLLSGTVGTTTNTSITSIASIGNGWYKCSHTFDSLTGASTPSFLVGLALSDNTETYTGDGYSGIYIWGAQLEAGAFPTSYIPTVASQVTRGADSASMTGVNFSSWYRADEGALYAESTIVNPVQVNATSFNIAGGTFSSYNTYNINIRHTGGLTSQSRGAVSDTTPQADIPVSSSGDTRKYALSYKANDFAFTANGAAATTDNSGAVPAGSNINQALIGGAVFSAAGAFCGHIKKISYYPQRLSNSELQSLTA